jgi:hypothetical protein
MVLTSFGFDMEDPLRIDRDWVREDAVATDLDLRASGSPRRIQPLISQPERGLSAKLASLIAQKMI